jgi:hypothetical protein
VSSLLILFNAIAKSVCVCGRVVEVGCCRVSGFHEAQLFLKLFLQNERVSVCETGGCAETNG